MAPPFPPPRRRPPFPQPPAWARAGLAGAGRGRPAPRAASRPRPGRCPGACAQPGFPGLLRAICGQQISNQAAAAIWRRLAALPGALEPAGLLALDDATLCGVGRAVAAQGGACPLAGRGLPGRPAGLRGAAGDGGCGGGRAYRRGEGPRAAGPPRSTCCSPSSGRTSSRAATWRWRPARRTCWGWRRGRSRRRWRRWPGLGALAFARGAAALAPLALRDGAAGGRGWVRAAATVRHWPGVSSGGRARWPVPRLRAASGPVRPRLRLVLWLVLWGGGVQRADRVAGGEAVRQRLVERRV